PRALLLVPPRRSSDLAVKREAIKGREGVVSNYMHDAIEEGDALFMSAPAGDFKVVEDHDRLLFIAGGVGATPVMSMAEDAVDKRSEEHTSELQSRFEI